MASNIAKLLGLGAGKSVATSVSGASTLLGEAKKALVGGLPFASLFQISKSN